MEFRSITVLPAEPVDKVDVIALQLAESVVGEGLIATFHRNTQGALFSGDAGTVYHAVIGIETRKPVRFHIIGGAVGLYLADKFRKLCVQRRVVGVLTDGSAQGGADHGTIQQL